jgi:hypothetical protein
MPLAPKGSKSSINKVSNSDKKYAPNNKVDKDVRKAASKGNTTKGAVMKVPGEFVSMASKKTINKAAATAKKRVS